MREDQTQRTFHYAGGSISIGGIFVGDEPAIGVPMKGVYGEGGYAVLHLSDDDVRAIIAAWQGALDYRALQRTMADTLRLPVPERGGLIGVVEEPPAMKKRPRQVPSGEWPE